MIGTYHILVCNTSLMMILLLLIHMMGIPLDMIQIEVILQTVPQLLQKPQKAQKAHLCIPTATIQNSTRVCRVGPATTHCTVQEHYAELLFQKSKGTKHCS